jgi:membrane-bound ClpP family serine protease
VEAGPAAIRNQDPGGGGAEPEGGVVTTDLPAPDVGQVSARYTPLWRAKHESRYLRQELIKAYQVKHKCRLVVMIDQIDPDSATMFAELLYGGDPALDLHLLLRSPGGDGEVAVRLARMAQAACRRFVVVAPDIAKSAATIFALGAHEILMGPTSDLGPIGLRSSCLSTVT